MSAEGQFLEAEYGFPIDYAVPGNAIEQSAALAQQTKTTVLSLATMLEYFWSFYEAMRQGRPLPNADQKLANLGNAMRTVIRRS